MTDHAEDERLGRTDEEDEPATAGAAGAAGAVTTAVESYETDDGTVFYESENPLAWVQSTVAVALHDSA